jgi:hypothetical protein
MVKAFVAIGLLVGSYLMAALVNAAPVTQPAFRSTGRARVIVVVPRGESPDAPQAEAPEVAVTTEARQSL